MGKLGKAPAAHLNLADLGKAPTGRAMDRPLGPVWTPKCIASRRPGPTIPAAVLAVLTVLTVIGCIAFEPAQ